LSSNNFSSLTQMYYMVLYKSNLQINQKRNGIDSSFQFSISVRMIVYIQI